MAPRAGPAPLVSILVPVYNEARTLPRVLKTLAALKLRKEILVIDDGSTDASSSILHRLAKPGIRVLRHARNRGKGAAIRTGLAAARGHFTLIQDADLETNPRDIPKLLRVLARRPGVAVFGTRFQAQRTKTPLPWLPKLSNRLLTGTTNLLFGSALTDMACAYKAASTRLLRSLRLQSKRFEVEAEITARLLKAHVPILEVPVRYSPRTYREGKKIHALDGLRILFTLVKLKLER